MEKTDPMADPVPKGLLFKRVPVFSWGKGPSYLGLCLGFSLKLGALRPGGLPSPLLHPKGKAGYAAHHPPRRAGPGQTLPPCIHSLIHSITVTKHLLCTQDQASRWGVGHPGDEDMGEWAIWPRRVCAWWQLVPGSRRAANPAESSAGPAVKAGWRECVGGSQMGRQGVQEAGKRAMVQGPGVRECTFQKR